MCNFGACTLDSYCVLTVVTFLFENLGEEAGALTDCQGLHYFKNPRGTPAEQHWLSFYFSTSVATWVSLPS